jgi:acyl-CoA thioester hydrolase
MNSGNSIITQRGVVYPAQCDAMGHLNVQHYTAVFDQAMWHLVFHLGYRPSWVTSQRRGWADVKYLINFRKELRLGELFLTESAVIRVGNSSLTSMHRILGAESGETAADAEITSVYFDLEKRASFPIPDVLKGAAQRMLQDG